MHRARDSRRQRLYDAEWSTLESRAGRFATLDEAQAFVNHVTASRFVRTRWGTRRITVARGRGAGGTSHGGGLITVGVGGQTTHVLLHEITHELLRDMRGIASHGPEFAAAFLLLVTRFMGKDTGDALRASYREHGVAYRTGYAKLNQPGTYPVQSQAEQRERKRAASVRPVLDGEAEHAAKILRRAIAAGMFGPAGRKPRIHAATVARTLENRGGS
jgi:putative metallohydrolase (TIGR04338 family)